MSAETKDSEKPGDSGNSIPDIEEKNILQVEEKISVETEDSEAPVDSGNSISDLEEKIIRQVEFYFGDFNVRRDKFLREEIKKDDGWVPLETLIKFNRLKSLSEDYEVICSALKKSSSGLMEINEDSTKVRRRIDKPVPTEPSDETADERTLYVKGFKRSANLDQLLEFFKEYKSEYIKMKSISKINKNFKGSVFVLFQTKKDADDFLQLKGIKYEGTELLKETLKDYKERKDLFFSNLRAEKEKKLASKKGATKTSKEKNSENSNVEKIPGALLKVTGLPSGTNREDIKEALRDYGTICFIDFCRGRTEGVVRFETGEAADVLEKVAVDEDGVKKLEINSVKAILSVLEGEEEKEYWKKIETDRANVKLNKWPKHQGRFQKKPWGKRQKNHNKGEHVDGPPSKKVKAENGENQETINTPATEAS